jgi:hypothetical protein
MKTESVAPDQLHNALVHADRTAGWNFRDMPIRTATVAGCAIYVVPAKLWAYRRQIQQVAEIRCKQVGQPPG